jgi:hypothetical protein
LNSLESYEYRGAAVLISLHEKYLQRFLETWKKAKTQNIILPSTDDPSYASLDTLLRHILRAARGYMAWICDNLELPDPEINPTPGVEEIAAQAEFYLEHLVEKWQNPLQRVPENRFYTPEYLSRWKTNYCIDAMLEHAVMHPLRHEYQLLRLLKK